MADPFKYILRFTIQPGHYELERLESLIDFCRDARIDDVTFFVDCEELNTGHIDPEALKPWLEMISRAKEQLKPLGITTSINPWTTLLHSDRGRKLKPGQNFTLMMDANGRQATAQACQICPEWRSYITDIYAQYSTVKPDMIWVEDDFRFHNHSPLEWGGCFCDRHMAEYSRRAGKLLTRQEFYEGILKPGQPHPYRRIWLDCCRESMVENARIIGDAVHAVSPDTKVGLMSSIPAVHCSEARDWHGILKGLSSGARPVNRPALMSYTEITPQSYLWDFTAVARLTRALATEDTETYPELDNGPFSRFNKSLASTRLQLETSLFLCSEGITMSLFDMIGSGVNCTEGFQKVLAESKPMLNQARSLGLEHKNQLGVTVLVCPESSYTLHTAPGAGMTGLYPKETFWASLLSSFGIACRYSMDKVHANEVIAVSGQYFRNLNKHEIEALFRDNSVLMDGEAANTLFEMGLGRLVGICGAQWQKADDGGHTFDEVCDGTALMGIAGARMSAQGTAGDYLAIEYTDIVSLKTVVRDYNGTLSGPGVASIGGRHLVYPYGRFGGRYDAHLHPFRRLLLLDALKALKPGAPLIYAEECPYIAVASFRRKEGLALVISNFSNDDMETLRIHVPGCGAGVAMVLRRSGWSAADGASPAEGPVTIPGGIRSMETLIVLLHSWN